MKLLLYIGISVFFSVGCQKNPSLGPAADSMSSVAPPPMGATTYNDELKKELQLLDDYMNNRVAQKQIALVKKALLDGDNKVLNASENAALVKMFLTLPELVTLASPPANQKRWLRAKLLFLKRRFIESSIALSEVLEHEPGFIEARNWRARALFFLGNPDMAVSELEKIIKDSPKDSEASLDAYYLIGAMIFESNDSDKKRIERGMNAWKRYLEHPKSPIELREEVKQSVQELAKRMETKIPSPSLGPVDPFSPNERYSAEKNAILDAFKQDQLLLAEELVNKALKKAYDVDIAIIKARVFFKNGRLDEAAALFKEITTKNKNYAPAFHYQGMAFMMQGKVKEALDSWRTTLKLDAAYATTHNLQQRIKVAESMVQPTKVESH